MHCCPYKGGSRRRGESRLLQLRACSIYYHLKPLRKCCLLAYQKRPWTGAHTRAKMNRNAYILTSEPSPQHPKVRRRKKKEADFRLDSERRTLKFPLQWLLTRTDFTFLPFQTPLFIKVSPDPFISVLFEVVLACELRADRERTSMRYRMIKARRWYVFCLSTPLPSIHLCVSEPAAIFVGDSCAALFRDSCAHFRAPLAPPLVASKFDHLARLSR